MRPASNFCLERCDFGDKLLTVDWAIQSVASNGGYLEHRQNSPIGITVLWRGWLQLQNLCEGFQLGSSWN